MGKLLEVKEFDTLICNKDYENEGQYKYLDRREFEQLAQFIREFSGDEENADALAFMKIGFRRRVGDVITIRNYVGLIQLNSGLQIQVLPKISLGDVEDDENRETKRVFLRMLRSMKDFPGKVFHEASLKVEHMNLYELFINMYLQEVRQLVKQGLKSSYVTREDNLKLYRGKLLVGRQLQSNLVHRERFFVSYDEFHLNRPENRIVKATLEKLQKLTVSAENAKEIRQLLTAFEMVDSSRNYHRDFAKVVIDRTTREYASLMQWSKVFLMNKSFATFAGSTTSRALLFPMESVYESYVAQQMRKVMGEAGWHISCQDKGHYLFTKPRQQFALRPDIVLERGGRRIIMDTKWKSLTDNERANYGISQGDMYQMYAYSRKYDTREIWLLYPVSDEMREHAPIEFDSANSDTGEMEVTVKVFFVDVANIEESLSALRLRVETELP